MRENLTARIFLIGLDARKFSCAKISTFTVCEMGRGRLGREGGGGGNVHSGVTSGWGVCYPTR